MRHNVDKLAAVATFGESYYTIDEGIDCVVLAKSDVEAGMMYGATLALDDIAGLA